MESLMLSEDGPPEDANPQDRNQTGPPLVQATQPTQPAQLTQPPLGQSGQWEAEEGEGEGEGEGEEDEDESMFDPLPADRQILCKPHMTSR
jgi:hypothetical protein